MLHFSILLLLVLQFMFPSCHLGSCDEELTTRCFKRSCTIQGNESISMEEGNIHHGNELS
jgi:hypothetical protein